MNSARERYRFMRHAERLLLWQIATAERERAIRKRTFKRAWLALPLNIALRIVIADNINLYNRTKNWKP